MWEISRVGLGAMTLIGEGIQTLVLYMWGSGMSGRVVILDDEAPIYI
jgi:hypothetical protein